MAADRNMRGGELRPDTRKDSQLGPEWRLEVSQLAANGIAAKVPHVWCGIHYRHRPPLEWTRKAHKIAHDIIHFNTNAALNKPCKQTFVMTWVAVTKLFL